MVGGNSARRRSAPDRLRATLASRLHNTVHTRGFSAGSTYRERRVGARLAPGGGLLRRGDQVMNASRSEGEHTPQTWSRGSSLFCFTLLEGAPPHSTAVPRVKDSPRRSTTVEPTLVEQPWNSSGTAVEHTVLSPAVWATGIRTGDTCKSAQKCAQTGIRTHDHWKIFLHEPDSNL